MRPLRVALVAGEHSGDQLGYKLMRALRETRAGRRRIRRRRRRGDGGRGAEEPVSDRRHRRHGHSPGAGPAADAPRADPRDRGGRRGGQARCAGHYRQPRLHPSRRPPRAGGAAETADRRLRQSERLGLAARPRQGDAGLCRLRAGAAPVRARGLPAAQRAALRLCRPSADRAARRPAAERKRSGAAALRRRR